MIAWPAWLVYSQQQTKHGDTHLAIKEVKPPLSSASSSTSFKALASCMRQAGCQLSSPAAVRLTRGADLPASRRSVCFAGELIYRHAVAPLLI